MQTLGKLFGSPARVKLLRLFAFNPGRVYTRDDIVVLSRVTPATATKEIAWLARIGLIKRKPLTREVVNRAGEHTKRKVLGWVLEEQYEHRTHLTNFLRSTLSIADADLLKRFKGVGVVRKLVLSGFLVGLPREGVLDVLVVGDKLNMVTLESVVRVLEAETGREIRYTVFTTEDYLYRIRVRDKLVRDVLDYPHRVLIDKVVQ
jgi:hypothetical protein